MMVSVKIFSLLSALTLLVGCGRSKVTDTPGGDAGSGEIKWGLVPSSFHPETEETKISVNGVRLIEMDLYGFNHDVIVTYKGDLPPNEGVIKGYTVWNKSYSGWQAPGASLAADTLQIKQYGSYSCQIKVANGEITELDGKCYTQIEVVLPEGAKIEVYSAGKLVSQRFFGMPTKRLIDGVDGSASNENKFKVIDEYLKSYEGGAEKPSLLASELGEVLQEFISREDRFQVLRRLQSYVSDRQNLVDMINDRFSFFEREEALKICGITEG